AFFVHELFRKANGLDSSRFLSEAEAKRLAQEGKLGGKRIVLLDDNFDYGEQCLDKLDTVLDVSPKARAAGYPIEGVTIASLFGFEDGAMREKILAVYRKTKSAKDVDLDQSEQKRSDGTDDKSEQNFKIDTVIASQPLALKDCPGVPE